MGTGKQVRIFLVDGNPNGVLTAEITNWTGHVVAAPRTSLDVILSRPEAKNTGVYVLLGDDPEGVHEIRAYIGEGDTIETRLRQHSKPSDAGGKDFWNRVVAITGKDLNITKAHARYLEARLIQLASSAKRSTLINSTNPALPGLPEADASDMEYFIDQIKIVLPVVGVNIFRPAPVVFSIPTSQNGGAPGVASVGQASTGEESAPLTDVPIFKLRIHKSPERFAEATEVDAEFIVLKDSWASGTMGVMQPGYAKRRQQLIDNARLVEDTAGLYRLTENTPFRSSSEAASVMNGSSENGRKRWVTDSGLTYGAWQSKGTQLEEGD